VKAGHPPGICHTVKAMEKFKRPIMANRLRYAYMRHLSKRVPDAKFRINWVERQRSAFLETADIVLELDVQPDYWIKVQFQLLNRSTCLKLFHLPYPPPGAMATGGAVDRFISYIGRADTLDVINAEKLERKAVEASDAMVDRLMVTHGLIRRDSDDYFDVIALHVNSGDISPTWLAYQDEDWLVEFIEKRGNVLREDVIDRLEKTLIDRKKRTIQ